MKKTVTIIAICVLIPFLFIASSPIQEKAPATDTYVVIAWNDLGMHCANKDFSNMCILPPYNNQSAVVIRRGSPAMLPLVMGASSGINVTYEVPGNTYSVGKTNFWSYANQIFGVTLPNNIGLTGYGLSGSMADSVNYFHVSGIPVTPFQDNDLVNENPFQLTLIKAFNLSGDLLATTQSVIPVSNEINCVSSGCHSSEMSILQSHPNVSGFNINNRPILCANCHADPVLGTTGNGSAPKFSQVIHEKHGDAIPTDCYKCHPGPNTQCLRDTMHSAGMWCTNCHGNTKNVAHTIEQGRTPWLQEPSCGAASCHGSNYAENPGKLFHESRGHGNLLCSTCHGSPHSILPSSRPEDNIQNIALQGFSGTLRKCSVCHGYTPAGAGPHGLYANAEPVSGTYTIPGTEYPTIASAFAVMNANGVNGPVTFLINSGYIENAVNLTLTVPTAGATSPITFKKNPSQTGQNPKITVTAGGSGSTDGGIIIAGTDYVTFEKVDIDASLQSSIEWGYALVKRRNTAPFDGCQHVAIKGCNITMNRTNVKSTGIYSGNHISTSTSSLSITSANDACNDCQIDGNVITNAYIGIAITGYAAPSPYSLYDHNNEVGQYMKNTILNFGGANTDAYGIYVAAQDKVKIMNDSIVSGTGSTQRVAGITLASGTSSGAEVSGNYISLISNATTSQNLYGIWNALGSTAASNCVRIHHNRIADCASTVASSSAPLYGIFNSASVDTIRIYDNTIYGSTLSTTGPQYVIRSQASANNLFINNNTVYNITNNGTGNMTMIHNQSSVTANIFSNTVYSCTARGGTVYGVYSALGTTVNVYKNHFYNLSSNNGSTASCLVYGIYNSSTPSITIYNNFISDLKANMATSNPSICGLYLTGGTTNTVYNNTVFLNATSSGSSFGSAAVYAGTTPVTNLRNNILVNISSHGASGNTVAFSRSSAAIGTYSGNNNDFYAGTPGPHNLIYFDGTNTFQGFSAYQGYVSPDDVASFSENPPFINTTSSPANLHIQTGVNTLCESGGSLVTNPQVSEDIDGSYRYPNPGYPDNTGQPATAPDVGADEFAGGPLPAAKTLNLTIFLEDFYNNLTRMMNKAQDCTDGANTFDKFQENVVDTLSVILANATNPWSYLYEIHGVNLNTDGSLSIPTIPMSLSGSYYVIIKHRQSVETWSSIPVSFSGSPVSYNFSSSSFQAYGNNLKLVATTPDVYAILSGDITGFAPNSQDGYADVFDNNDVFNKAQLAAYGYMTEDLNEDAFVDIFDMALVFNNMQLAVGMITPPNPGKKK